MNASASFWNNDFSRQDANECKFYQGINLMNQANNPNCDE